MKVAITVFLVKLDECMFPLDQEVKGNTRADQQRKAINFITHNSVIFGEYLNGFEIILLCAGVSARGL